MKEIEGTTELRWFLKKRRTHRGSIEVSRILQYRVLESFIDSEDFKSLHWSKWKNIKEVSAYVN